MVKTERITDRHHPLTDFKAIGVAKRYRWQILTRVNFDYRDIGLLILADHLGIVIFPVRQSHGNLLSPVHDVVIREYGTVTVDDEYGTQTVL